MNKLTEVSLFGATGLVGSKLLEMMTHDPEVASIIVVNRREIGYDSEKVKEIVIDLDELDKHPEVFEAKKVVICLGTTMKKAGSKAAFEKVDYHIVKAIAEGAKASKVKRLLMISSLGADPDNSNFYLKTKGRAESAIEELGIEEVAYFRPSLLLGDRSEFRLGEWFAQKLMPLISPLMLGKLKKYRPISADTVAKAMLHTLKANQIDHIYESDEIIELSKQEKA